MHRVWVLIYFERCVSGWNLKVEKNDIGTVVLENSESVREREIISNTDTDGFCNLLQTCLFPTILYDPAVCERCIQKVCLRHIRILYKFCTAFTKRPFEVILGCCLDLQYVEYVVQ